MQVPFSCHPSEAHKTRREPISIVGVIQCTTGGQFHLVVRTFECTARGQRRTDMTRRGSHLDRRSHPNVLPEANARHTGDLTSEMRYTARGRFMSCLPCTFPPQQHCQSTKQPSPSSSNPFTLVSFPNIIAASGQQKLMIESGVCGPPLRWAWL